ncbi:porin [Cupriavidus necator]
MSNKKIQIGLAALCTVSAAHAQSGVTLYGVVDSPVEYVNHLAGGPPAIDPVTGAITQRPGGDRFSLVNSGGASGSRWGLRGVEELGGGLNAVFVLESGFGADNGNMSQGGRLFGRQAFVGLESKGVGRLTFGRQYTSIFEAFSNFTPLAYAPLYEPSSLLLGANNRSDNTVKYLGAFGPVTAVAHFTFGAGTGSLGSTALAGGGAGESAGHFRDNSGYGASVTYSGGAFGATIAYDQWNPAVTAGNAGSAKKAGTAVSYKYGPAKFVAGYRWGDTKDSAGNTLLRDDFYWVGVNYKATSAVSLDLAYYYDNPKTLRVSPTAPAISPANPWQVSFRAIYSLSKRTDLYMTTAYAKNSGLNFDTSANGFASGYFLSPGSDNQFGAAVGVRHRF